MWNRILDRIVDAILDRLQPVIETQLDQFRTEALTMLAEALPEMAGAVAEQTVLTVFEQTQVDEAVDAVAGVIQRIVDRLPRIPIHPWEPK